jgi:hypothetical protein
MGAAMPFSKYNIDPEHIEAMRAAFHWVCDILQLNSDADDPMTEIVVMKIVELAKAGELDPERLCIAVLADLDDAPRAGAAADSPAAGDRLRLAGGFAPELPVAKGRNFQD